MKNKKILIAIIVLIFVFMISVCFSLFNMGNNNIISGISINKINVSGQSKEQAKDMILNLIEKKKKTEEKLKYQGKSENDIYETSLDLSILNIEYNLDKAINEAYYLGREGNIFQNNFKIAKTLLKHKNIELETSLDDKMLNSIISDISANLPGKLIQSSYYTEDKNLVITKGQKGIIVDEEAFKSKLNEVITNLSYDKKEIEIPVKEVEPDEINLDKIHEEIYKEPKDAYYEKKPFKVYAEVKGVDFDVEQAKKEMSEKPEEKEYKIELKYTDPKTKLSDIEIDVFPDLLATFSTRYDVSNKDRSTNLNLAAKKINGTILSPGEEFSYNKVVGERSIAAGYKEAKVYVNGKIENGLGGGICQVSSTLYNAVVFANLKVTQRYNHQFTTSYVQPGRDATVAYGSKDFKVKNNRAYPIKIKVSINSGIAKVDIYGIKEEKEYDVTIDVETISNIPYDTKYEKDSSLPSGTEKVKQRGVDGIIVNAYKVKNLNGVTVSRELISKDKYNSLDKVVVRASE